MGIVKKDLVRITLPDREVHNSRIFVDLCENVHIHHREFRVVFSLDEYFEFADVLHRSTEDLRSYLAQNPDYKEGKYGTTIMIAGGAARQRKLLQNSPAPNRSAYFPNDFAIELQDESVVDEIHVHWRDYRFALSRRQFKLIADAFSEAKHELDLFERDNSYQRKPHHDRAMEDYAKERVKYAGHVTGIAGEVFLPITDIRTRFDDGIKSFTPEAEAIAVLEKKYRAGEYIFPIVLSTEKEGEHHVIDGNHRLYAAKAAGLSQINCIVTDLTFDQTVNFRKAEGLLKKFDRETKYIYGTSDFNRAYFAHRASRHYRNHFRRLIMKDKKTKRGKANWFKTAFQRLRRIWKASSTAQGRGRP